MKIIVLQNLSNLFIAYMERYINDYMLLVEDANSMDYVPLEDKPKTNIEDLTIYEIDHDAKIIYLERESYDIDYIFVVDNDYYELPYAPQKNWSDTADYLRVSRQYVSKEYVKQGRQNTTEFCEYRLIKGKLNI